MLNRNVVRGVFLMAVAAFFGSIASRYPFGAVGRAGPGLFPIFISGLLALVGLAMIVRARFTPAEPLNLPLRNIGIILASLVTFSLVSEHVNMAAGIVSLVLVSSAAGQDWSWKRNAKVAAGLLAIAFAFHELLGLQLPLLGN